MWSFRARFGVPICQQTCLGTARVEHAYAHPISLEDQSYGCVGEVDGDSLETLWGLWLAATFDCGVTERRCCLQTRGIRTSAPATFLMRERLCPVYSALPSPGKSPECSNSTMYTSQPISKGCRNVFWPIGFLEAWGTKAQTPHFFKKRERRRQGQTTTRFWKICVFLALVPQTSKKTTWPKTTSAPL